MIYQLTIRGMAIQKVIERILSSVISNGYITVLLLKFMYFLVSIVTVTQQSAKSIIDIISPGQRLFVQISIQTCNEEIFLKLLKRTNINQS